MSQTKTEKLIHLLKRHGGATIPQLLFAAASPGKEWNETTLRGWIANSKAKLGITRVNKGTYAIVAPADHAAPHVSPASQEAATATDGESGT